MYETKYYKTFIVILLLRSITLCNSNLAKFNLLKPRDIFYDGKIVSIESFLKEGVILDIEGTSEHPNVVYTSMKCVLADTIVDILQTFFEILDYGVNSHVEINIPDIKEYTINWLITAIIHFNNIKPAIAKTIDNLFNYSNKIQYLRISDQSLLKSLLSINLFLYYNISNSPFVIYSRIVTNNLNEPFDIMNDNSFNNTIKNFRVLNTSIIQMIGLVERFRSKRCVVHNPYTYNYVIKENLNGILIRDVDNIKRLLEPSLHKLNVLVNEGSDNYDEYNSKIYDPEYLLLENLLNHDNSILGNVQIILDGRESDLLSMFNDTIETLDIAHVLVFQNTLITVIAELYYIHIYYLSQFSLEHSISDLTDLYSNFKKYTDEMLPSNCSIVVCNKILKARVFLDKVFENFDYSENSNIMTKLRNRFKPQTNIEIINLEIQQILTVDPSLTSMATKMMSDSQYLSFIKVAEILSYESYANSDFYINKDSDHWNIISSQTYNKTFLKSIIEMQYALFAFSTLLNPGQRQSTNTRNIIHYSNVDYSDLSSIGFTTPGNYTGKNKNKLSEKKIGESDEFGPIFADMLHFIVKLYKELDDKPDVQTIFLPLLIHFQHTDKCSRQISKYELSVMSQTSFLTIIIIENYLIKNYSLSLYSLFLYSKFIMNHKNGPNFRKLRHDLQCYAETPTNNFENTLEFLNGLYDVNSYNEFFPDDDKQIQFDWNGSKYFGYDIFQIVIKGVIDINDVIHLQRFGVKWFVSKILVMIWNSLAILTDLNSSKEIFFITKRKLNELLMYEFPKPIKIFLDDLVNATLTTLNIDWTDLDENIFDKLDTLFENGLIVLDAHSIENETLSAGIENSINSLNAELEKLTTFSKSNFLGIHNLIISTDLCLSPVKNKITYKIIDILIQDK